MKVFVTGIGTINAIGDNADQTFAGLKRGESGISTLRYLKTMHTDLPCGEIKMSYEQLADFAQVNRNSPLVRTPLMGLVAAREAVNSARLSKTTGGNMAFISGTTVGGMDRMEQFYDDFVNNDSKNRYLYPHDIGDSTQYIADKLGLFSFATSISTACSSGANAIIFGAELIKSGRYDIVVAGGCESLSSYHFNGFNSLMILDKQLCRPFDDSRSGLNLGEGAGYIVLESEISAKRRRAEILCELTGYGNACDAFHQTATSENGEGPYLAMTKALEMAELKPCEIDYVNAHGTGTPNNDLTESVALKRVFGANSVPDFSSTKAFTGHTTSAAGGVEAVISVMCLMNDFLPKSLNFSNPIPETGLIPLTENKEKFLRSVMTNSFGFGGNDSSLIFSRL
ncbi:MAG: beta-ketoacyl-[acyl-carrier-protein] synthase family protein [Bacteroidales bacterium]|nr:beta-ketoacyl-[acyl-carrier-protein] synthase family protein [Bacteroidales bacterium]